MVYSSSRLCSSFSVVSYSLLSSRVLSVTLTVRFCQLRSLRSLPAFLFFFLFITFFTLRDTHFLFPILFSRQFSSVRFSSVRTLIFLISYIYFSDMYVYIAEFSFQSYARLLTLCCAFSSFCSCACSLHARYVCFFPLIARNAPRSNAV